MVAGSTQGPGTEKTDSPRQGERKRWGKLLQLGFASAGTILLVLGVVMAVVDGNAPLVVFTAFALLTIARFGDDVVELVAEVAGNKFTLRRQIEAAVSTAQEVAAEVEEVAQEVQNDGDAPPAVKKAVRGLADRTKVRASTLAGATLPSFRGFSTTQPVATAERLWDGRYRLTCRDVGLSTTRLACHVTSPSGVTWTARPFFTIVGSASMAPPGVTFPDDFLEAPSVVERGAWKVTWDREDSSYGNPQIAVTTFRVD